MEEKSNVDLPREATLVQPVEAEVGLSRAEAIIQGWVEGHLRNSPLSRDTAAWNFLQLKLPDLAALIEKEQ